MPHTPALSLPHASPSDQMRLNRRLRRWLARELRWLRPVIATSAAQCQAERYRKHFDAFAHACLLLFHALSGSPSLRQSYATFAVCPGLVTLSGLSTGDDPEDDRLGISYSQFAASNTSRPADFLGGIVPILLTRLRTSGTVPPSAIPDDLHVFDSTFLRLSLRLASWVPSTGKADVPGVRVHVQYLPALDVPAQVLVTTTRTNDCQGFDHLLLDAPARLTAIQGQTVVIDLGYYSHKRFERLRAAGVHFVTRRQAQAHVRVEEDLPVQPPLPTLSAGRITVQQDQRVTVGSPNNRAGAVLPNLRLVTAHVAPQPAAARQGAQPVVYQILTDRWDLTAAEVVQIYLWRWQIELFFRWLKSHVHLPRLLGYSRNAVELTVWLAIVAHLLSLLAARALGFDRRSPALLRQLIWALVHVSLTDAPQALPIAHQLAFPGWELPLESPT